MLHVCTPQLSNFPQISPQIGIGSLHDLRNHLDGALAPGNCLVSAAEDDEADADGGRCVLPQAHDWGREGMRLQSVQSPG